MCRCVHALGSSELSSSALSIWSSLVESNKLSGYLAICKLRVSCSFVKCLCDACCNLVYYRISDFVALSLVDLPVADDLGYWCLSMMPTGSCW